MTEIKLGGGPNPPVILDPAQVIVNVHWPTEEAEDTFIVFSTEVRLGSTVEPLPPFPGHDNTRFEPDFFDWKSAQHTSQTRFYRDNQPVRERLFWDGGYISTSAQIQGMPDYTATESFAAGTFQGVLQSGSYGWSLPAAGTVPGGPRTPFDAQLFFNADTSPTFFRNLDATTGEREWIRSANFGVVNYGYLAPVNDTWDVPIFADPLDLSGVFAVQGGREYRPVGTALDTSSFWGVLWVLMAPVTEGTE